MADVNSKTDPDARGLTRRDVMRIVALGGLILGVGVLIKRPGDCKKQLPCANCREFNACTLPQAQQTRERNG